MVLRGQWTQERFGGALAGAPQTYDVPHLLYHNRLEKEEKISQELAVVLWQPGEQK